MSKNLVIVESPSKGKTIEKFLGKDYKVVASMGHIRDLPVKELGVDIKNDFKPEYLIPDEKKKTVKNLQDLATASNEVWIATDEDREGEAIGWHLCHILGLDPNSVKRIVFHEITKTAIENSIKNPRNVDINLVDAQQARRILDRLVGYKVSPILWTKVRKGLSAGRVQSVAVKLIVEKEREIMNFKPKESWKLKAKFSQKTYCFDAILTKIGGKSKTFTSKEDVEKYLHTLVSDLSNFTEKKDKSDNLSLESNSKIEFVLNSTDKNEVTRMPQAPFTTSTLQQEASRKFGFSVKKTMLIAQKLYEGVDLGNGERQGLITYMRTDSVNLSDFAQKESKKMIEKLYGKGYVKNRNFKTKNKQAQEANEAIRPTDFTKTPQNLEKFLDKDELKLYELIWKRTLASQMKEALVEITTLDFSPVESPNSNWIAKGEVIKFDGFMKLYVEDKDDDEQIEIECKTLPELNVGDKLKSSKISALQSFSRPPARYTEASLVKKLEGEGIGRPSTYAPTISTIIDRGYVEKFERKYLKPTDIAFVTNDFLEEYFKQMMDYKFTSKVEEDFDKVASGEESYTKMLSDFWENSLKKDLDNAKANAEKVVEKVGKNCPECGSELIYRYSKGGKFIGCSKYPDCKYIERDEKETSRLEQLKAKYEGQPCPEGGEIVVKVGRFGPFLASSLYPEVKRIGKIKSEKDEILDQILAEKGLLKDEETGEELVVKSSRRGQFLAAKRYPEVKISKPIPKDVWDELKKGYEVNLFLFKKCEQ